MRHSIEPIRLLYLATGGSVDDAVADLDVRDDRFVTTVETDPRDWLDRRDGRVTSPIDCVVARAAALGGEGTLTPGTVRERVGEVPVFALTDSPWGDDAAAALASGATDVLPAGGRAPDGMLADRVATAVDRRRMTQNYDEFLDAASDGVCVLDPERRTVCRANDRLQEMLGLDGADLRGRTVSEVLPADASYDGQTVRECIRTTADAEASPTELVVETNDGDRLPIAVHLEATTVDGRDRVVAFVSDVSERKRREETLTALNQTSRSLMQVADEGSVAGVAVDAARDILGMPSAAVMLWNETSRRLEVVEIGAEDREMFGEPPAVATGEGIVGAAFEAGETAVFDDLRASDYDDTTGIRSYCVVPIGEQGVLLAASDAPDEFDDDDVEIVEILAANVEAALVRVDRETSLREREGELERQNDRIESLHAVATEMKTATDREDIYELVIEAVEEILEFDICIIDELEGDVLVPRAVGSGMSLEDYYDETPVDEDDNLGAETYREGDTRVVDDLHAAGYAPANFAYRSAISVSLSDRGVFQAVAEEHGAFDESDRRLVELLVEHAVAAVDRLDREQKLQERAAVLERQNERLDRFASIVSHDLRNPLSVAKGRLELAAEESDSEHLEDVRQAHDRMRTLIDDLLGLARAGEVVTAVDTVSLAGTAESCWQTVDTGDAALRIETDAQVEADPSRLQQLFENLVRNAVEHGTAEHPSSGDARLDADGGETPRGGTTVRGGAGDDEPSLTVTVGALEDGFYVADDGDGIPPSERDRVFEGGYSTDDDGTGFGLSIVEQIVDAHDWDVSVAESADGGARFEIRGVSLADA